MGEDRPRRPHHHSSVFLLHFAVLEHFGTPAGLFLVLAADGAVVVENAKVGNLVHDLLVVCLGLYRLVLAHGLAERVHAWPPTAAAILLLALTLTLTLTPNI